jgi:hypothetical protein
LVKSGAVPQRRHAAPQNPAPFRNGAARLRKIRRRNQADRLDAETAERVFVKSGAIPWWRGATS